MFGNHGSDGRVDVSCHLERIVVSNLIAWNVLSLSVLLRLSFLNTLAYFRYFERFYRSLAHFSTSTGMVDYVNDVYQSKTIHPSSMARYNHLAAFPNVDVTLMEGHLLANVPGKNDPYIVASLFTAHFFFFSSHTSGSSVGSRSGTTTTRWLDRVRTSTVERIFVSGRVQPVHE